jgi:hypothetical protein
MQKVNINKVTIETFRFCNKDGTVSESSKIFSSIPQCFESGLNPDLIVSVDPD